MAFGIRKRKDDRIFQADLAVIRQRRRNRFRILVCVDGSDESCEGLRFAAIFGQSDDCDIVLLYVRRIDQRLRSGGLQERVARENMMEWGLELPGIRYPKRGLGMLIGDEEMSDHWSAVTTHTDTWGDPLGDNKVEYHHESDKNIVLKLKTAPDPASGILDQYELGPYNRIIMGAPSRWRGDFRSFFNAGVAQKVAMLAPYSVMVARANGDGKGKGHLICIDGTKNSLDAMRRDAVLAHHSGYPITLFAVARQKEKITTAERVLENSTEMLAKIEIEIAGTKIGVGEPTEQIVRAGNDYSVIAVADSEKKWFQRFFDSSVAFGVMGAASTSVLNVR